MRIIVKRLEEEEIILSIEGMDTIETLYEKWEKPVILKYLNAPPYCYALDKEVGLCIGSQGHKQAIYCAHWYPKGTIQSIMSIIKQSEERLKRLVKEWGEQSAIIYEPGVAYWKDPITLSR